METKLITDRWISKLKEQYDGNIKEIGEFLAEKQGIKVENLDKYTNCRILLDPFLNGPDGKPNFLKRQIPLPKSKDIDIYREVDSQEESQVDWYPYYFISQLPNIIGKCCHAWSPSTRDLELARDLGYEWIISPGESHLLPLCGERKMYELLEDACFKYKLTCDFAIRVYYAILLNDFYEPNIYISAETILKDPFFITVGVKKENEARENS